MTATRTSTARDDAGDRALARAFVRRHFSPLGTVRLHRHALGPDLLRAPINVALAPLALVARLAAMLLGAAGARRAAAWLAGRRFHLVSDVSAALEAALLAEVVAPRLAPGAAPSRDQRRLIDDYLATRAAVAEIVTTLALALAGFVLFRAVTPGVFSLAPLLSDRAAHARAVADFPLGQSLGWAWYGLFPYETPGWLLALVIAGLMLGLALATSFAGLLADPAQAVLGLHRRRLLRLMAALDRAEAAAPGVAPEHLVARAGDLADLVAALLKTFRP